MADEDRSTTVILFGRDIAKIPCFRNSFLCGIGSGLAGGLATFMFTSRPRLGGHIGAATFFTVSMVYWVQCRYRWSQERFAMSQVQGAIQSYVALEGSEKARELERKASELPLADA